MSHIKSRKHAPHALPTRISPAASLFTGLALVMPIAHANAAESDADTRDTPRKEDAATLDNIQVRGSWFGTTNAKFTAELVDTPKTLSIVTEDLLNQTGAVSLQDALRMVPGITFGAGEGGNPTGDRPFIRGFDGQSNTFIDGMRDVGMQTREVFNLEQVEVVKGPSSAYGGRDSGGGSINLVSKTPKLRDENRVSLGAGTDSYLRGTADVNYVLGEGIATRVNLMAHESDIAGRDVANVSRKGIAPSIGFGLNGDAQLIVGLYSMTTDDLPDAGGFPYNNPFAATSPNAHLNGDGSPIVPGGNREAYYGLVDRDFQRTRADIGTLDASYAFGDHKVRNVARIASTSNDYLWTQPDDSKGNVNLYDTLWRRTNSRAADVKSVADQLSLTGLFRTGAIDHSYSTGIEYSNEKMSRGSYAVTPGTNNPLTGNQSCPTTGEATGWNCTSFQNPNPHDPWAATHIVTRSNLALDTEQETRTTSVYVFDTIALSEQWLLNLGLRWDDYRTTLTTPSATAAATVLRNKSDFVNYQAGVIFKPVENGSIYFSYGTSSTPPGMDGGDGADGLSAAIQNLKPQETTNTELGVKWNLFDNALGLTAAVFHTVMDNARVTSDAGTTQNVGKKSVDGVEVGFNGSITRQWSVYGGYSWLDATLDDAGYVNAGTAAAPNWVPSPNNGNQFPNNARHSANLWTTYQFASGLTLGGGANHVGKQYGNAANTKWIPGYIRWDAMASYAFGARYNLQLNVQNLTDKLYFNKPYASHYAGIAPGRSATLTFNASF